MISPEPPLLRAATHVVFDPSLHSRLLELGATKVVLASDCLLIGPSRRDVVEHARVRQAWWRSSETWDHLYSSAARWEPPVVVWVSASLQERVNAWRTCAWLRHLGIAHRDVLLLDFAPSPAKGTRPPFDCTASVSVHADDVLLERLANARPWPRARYDRAVSLWDSYVDANPVRFVRSCTRGAAGFPELAPLWAFLASFFPRKTGDGALRLGRFDELLLALASTEWQTPLSVFAHDSGPGEELRHLLSCTGDLFLPERMEQWAQHTPSAALERAAGPSPDLPMKSHVYRLTESGARLRAHDLERLSDAPPLPMFGACAYAPGERWVVLDDGRLARLSMAPGR